jgi:hypothetical protein
MPFIPRQVKPPARQVITCRLPEETATLLKRYADFLDSTQEYVVNETLLVAFRRDKEFQAWLAATPTVSPQQGREPVLATRQAERERP